MSHDPKSPGPAPVFIFGCQRSGTTLLQEVLGLAPEVAMFHESDPRAMTPDHRLLPRDTVPRLIASEWPRRTVLKPLVDSHQADQLLAQYPGSRALWLYRRYPDVVNSLERIWPGSHRGPISCLRHRQFDLAGWMGERVSDEVLAHVDALWRDDLTDLEAAALTWCMRNYLYFELGLDRMADRVLLIKYRDMVEAAEEVMPRVFQFLELPYDPAYVAGIQTWNIGKEPEPPLDPRIQALCERMLERLDAARPMLRASMSRLGPKGAAGQGQCA